VKLADAVITMAKKNRELPHSAVFYPGIRHISLNKKIAVR
jgi:hypothetical protein